MTKKKKLLIAALACVATPFAYSYWAAGGEDRDLRRPERVSATPFPQRDVVVDGLRLRYVDVGEGTPVILLPGLTSRIEELDVLTARLSGRYRVLAFDFPGTGYSEKPDREYSLSFYDDILIAFMDALEIPYAHVAGGSLGGNLALRAAHGSPHRVLTAAAWGPGSAWEAKPALAALMRVVGGRTLFWPTVRVQSGYWYSDGWPGADERVGETFAYYDEILCPAFIRMYWDLAAEQTGWSLTEIAADIDRPVLLVWGDRDHGWGMGQGVMRLHGLIGDSRLVVIEDAGHALVAERPDELADALVRALDAYHRD